MNRKIRINLGKGQYPCPFPSPDIQFSSPVGKIYLADIGADIPKLRDDIVIAALDQADLLDFRAPLCRKCGNEPWQRRRAGRTLLRTQA